MKILIIGSGMYVTGRNNSGTGTILSALAQLSKTMPIEKVCIFSKSSSSKKNVVQATNRINKILSAHLPVSFTAMDKMNKLGGVLKKEKFDLAIISVPDHLHFSFAKIVLENKIHCLLVKPLTPTISEAKQLLKIQQENKVYAAVEFHKRWDETNLYVKKIINEKELGKINYFTVDYSQRINIPARVFKSWSANTNIFQYLGVHYVDLIYFLTGYSPVKVCAVGTNGILKQNGINTYDSVHAAVIWQNPKNSQDRFVSVINTNWVDPNVSSALSDQKYTVAGTLGRLECDQKKRGLELVTEQKGVQHINPYFSEYLPDENNQHQFGGYGYESIKQFIIDVHSLKNNKTQLKFLDKHRPSFNSALVSTKVIDAANQSLVKNFQWVKIN